MAEVFKGIFMEEIPLKNNPLKALNCFIFSSNGQNLLVDSGFDEETAKKALDDIIEKYNLNPQNTRVFLTHHHSDHAGNIPYLEDKGFKIISNVRDMKRINEGITQDRPSWLALSSMAKSQDLEKDVKDVLNNPGFYYRAKKEIHPTIVEIGDIVEVGDFKFEVVDLQGHTPNQCGLYDREKKILHAADAILAKITPNITFWGFDYGDSLGKYFATLDKIRDMDVDILLSCHRSLIEDKNKRVDELKEHHRRRLEDIRGILSDGSYYTPRDVAMRMKWDISSKTWEDFPSSQKWFAVGEAHAHLEHLRALEELEFKEENNIYYYRKRK